VGYGRVIPNGSLPVFSVGTEAEARRLLVLACPMSVDGDYYAPELAREQTLDNLEAFSDRLDRAHGHLVNSGRCECAPNAT
jgi:hypothetical protein